MNPACICNQNTYMYNFKGTASFLKKTVYGFSDTFSKFTGSLGKGLASATMDSEFQQHRLQAKKRNRPKHAASGVAAGASSLARGIVSGLTGIVVRTNIIMIFAHAIY
jgi:vacuolar protein sorting-associated protein 13A/C